MVMQILSSVELNGGLAFTLDADFPANPALGTLWFKDGCVYLYGKIGGLETWYPFASKTNSYVHTQGLPATTWTVNHGLGVEDVWYQVKNADGQIVQAQSEVLDQNTILIKFTSAIVGTVVVVAPASIDVPQVKASLIDVANGAVAIDSSGVKVNGQTVLTSASIAQQIEDAVAPKADTTALNSAVSGLQQDISVKLNKAGDSTQDVAVKQLTTSGGIVPSTSGLNIGSPTQRFAAIYVDEAHLATNTLYIGDTPILGTDADTVQIKTDPNQHISMETSGTGTTTITSERGVTMSTSGLNADVVVQASGAGAKVRFGAQSAIEFTAPDATFSGNQTVAGNLTVAGTVLFQGSSVTVNSTQVSTKDNIVVLNAGEPGSGVTAGKAGIQVDRGDSAAAQIIFQEDDDLWRVGLVGSLEILATRPWAISMFAPIGHVGTGGTAHAEATTNVAGFMSSADKTKLDGVATGATANATNAQLRDRSTHTGTQTSVTISDFATAAASAAPVKTVAGAQPDSSGDVPLTKSSVGLGNVDNTSDANKPISAATQAALTALTARVATLENLLSNGTVKYDGHLTV